MSENLQPTCNQLATDCISRQAAIKAICEDGTWLESQGCTEITMAERKQRDADILGELPSAQPDSGYIEQIKWERDLAIRQLADLGYGLGEKPRTNGDFISRQAAIDALNEFIDEHIKIKYGLSDSAIGAMNSMVDIIGCDVPSAKRKGEWKIKAINTFNLAYGGIGYEPVYECSVCGGVEESYLRLDEPIMPEDADFPSFCPNCGADMRERKEK